MREDRIRREGKLISEIIRRVPLIVAVLKEEKVNFIILNVLQLKRMLCTNLVFIEVCVIE